MTELSSAIETDVRGDVLRVVLNRPDRRNAITREMTEEIVQTLGSAHERSRCVVITGKGSAFCAGADLRGNPDRVPGVGVFDSMQMNTQALVSAIQECRVPVIASVNGPAAGLGMSIALAADLLVMSQDARLIAAQLSRAIVPDGGLGYLLPRHVGLARAKRIVLSGKAVSAEEAVAIGLAAEVVPTAELVTATERWATDVAQLPTKVANYALDLLETGMTQDWSTFLFMERSGQALMSTSADALEGIAAFKERREARYRGE